MRASLSALAAAIVFLVLAASRGGAQGLQDIPVTSSAATGPVVAELFTSQSCSSCPPAEKLFAELADRDDLVVLEWHVDYWDRLIHGRAGAWKDPYSSAAHTARQRRYNRALRSTVSVYTPQAVINGRSETVGSRPGEVERLLTRDPHTPVALQVETKTGTISAHLPALDQTLTRAADVYRLTLLPQQTTAVPSGENRGALLTSRNLVIAMETIGTYSGSESTFEFSAPVSGETCAVIVQAKHGNRLGPILAASYC
ncbi:MAG: DUF1223 domain-containing protein [Pseudomonadota bacterium]